MELITRDFVRSLWGCQHVDWVYLSSIGALGGILVMWDRRAVEKLDEAVGQFSVSCKIGMRGTILNGFFGLYGPNVDREKKLMWEELEGLNSWWSLPWCVGGDFNAICFSLERLGDVNITQIMHKFSDFISFLIG